MKKINKNVIDRKKKKKKHTAITYKQLSLKEIRWKKKHNTDNI